MPAQRATPPVRQRPGNGRGFAALPGRRPHQGPAGRREIYLAFNEGIQLCEQGRIDRGLLWLARSLELAAPLNDPDLDRVLRVNLADWSALLTQPALRVKFPREVRGLVYHPKED